jgi:hypothetical protein
MNIYNFPLKKTFYSTNPFQPIDLNYIVSITPLSVTTCNPSSGICSQVSFVVYIKIGHPIALICFLGSHIEDCPQEIIDEFEIERTKLIEAWRATKERQLPELDEIFKDTQLNTLTDDVQEDKEFCRDYHTFQRGRMQGIQVCYDYITKSIRR